MSVSVASISVAMSIEELENRAMQPTTLFNYFILETLFKIPSQLGISWLADAVKPL